MKKLLITFISVICGAVLAFSFVNIQNESQSAKSVLLQPTTNPIPSPTITSAPAPSTPLTIKIPTLGVTADVEIVGKDEQGRMDIPIDYYNAAWYGLGPKPGEVGNSVIAGHLDTPTGDMSIFYFISNLNTGDEIIVTDEEGKDYTFNVVSVESFEDATFPLERVFGKNNEKNLNLITCAGVFDRNSSNYSHRTVVFAKLNENKSPI